MSKHTPVISIAIAVIVGLLLLFVASPTAKGDYLGTWNIDDYVTFTCNTHTFATGEAADADADPNYYVYEDITDPDILHGTMSKLDDSNTVGFYYGRIQLTAANGFEQGKHYTIYVEAEVSAIDGTLSHNFQVGGATDLQWIDAQSDTPTDMDDMLENAWDATENLLAVNCEEWNDETIPATNQTGVPKVDMTHIEGSDASSSLLTTNDVNEAIWTTIVADKAATGNVAQALSDLVSRLTAVRAGLIDNLSGFDANTVGTSAMVGTVATAATTKSFTLSTDFKAGLGAYKGQLITITDAGDSNKETRRIVSYSAARYVIVDEKFSFTPANSDVAVVSAYQEPRKDP